MSKKEFTPAKSQKLTVPEVIEYCKNNLGITFNLMDEEKAKSFLEKNNFFFRLKQYCSTCTKLVSSPRVKEMTLKEIKDFFDDRMVYRKQYFYFHRLIRLSHLMAGKHRSFRFAPETFFSKKTIGYSLCSIYHEA